jgi:hypothetical protein
MNRLVRRQRAALALFIAMTVSGIGVALADPQGEQPNTKIDVSPTNGQNLPTPTSVQVTGTGFASNGVGTSGIIVQTAELPNGTSAVSATLGTFTSNGAGTFTQTVNVSQTFLDAGSNQGVDCNAAGVQCYVQATSNSGNFNAAHTISFGGGGTTSTTVTIPPTTSTSTSTTVTIPPTTSTSTSTTVPVTTSTSTSTTVPVTTSTSTSTTVPVTTSTSTSTTLPTTTSTSTTLPTTTSTTLPTTTSSVVTTTSLPGTTTTIGGPTTTLGPAGCAALRQARANLNAQIDAARASVIAANLPAAHQAAALAQLEAIRAQGNAQIDARLVGCPAP